MLRIFEARNTSGRDLCDKVTNMRFDQGRLGNFSLRDGEECKKKFYSLTANKNPTCSTE